VSGISGRGIHGTVLADHSGDEEFDLNGRRAARANSTNATDIAADWTDTTPANSNRRTADWTDSLLSTDTASTAESGSASHADADSSLADRAASAVQSNHLQQSWKLDRFADGTDHWTTRFYLAEFQTGCYSGRRVRCSSCGQRFIRQRNSSGAGQHKHDSGADEVCGHDGVTGSLQRFSRAARDYPDRNELDILKQF
jgi:hypothetical protein